MMDSLVLPSLASAAELPGVGTLGLPFGEELGEPLSTGDDDGFAPSVAGVADDAVSALSVVGAAVVGSDSGPSLESLGLEMLGELSVAELPWAASAGWSLADDAVGATADPPAASSGCASGVAAAAPASKLASMAWGLSGAAPGSAELPAASAPSASPDTGASVPPVGGSAAASVPLCCVAALWLSVGWSVGDSWLEASAGVFVASALSAVGSTVGTKALLRKRHLGQSSADFGGGRIGYGRRGVAPG